MAPIAEPSRTQEWREWRRQGIGGSDAAAVCGLSPWKSPLAVYYEKTTEIEDEEDDVMKWGRRLEPAIVTAFQEETGYSVHSEQAMVVHPSLPFMRATIDGGVYGHGRGLPQTADGVYEAKSVSRRAADWDQGIPDYVQIQLLHNLGVTTLGRAWLAALMLVPVPRLIIHEFERDQEALTVLMEIEAEFWERVEKHIPPPADGTEATATAIRQAYKLAEPGRIVDLTPEHLELILARDVAVREEKEAIARREAIDNRLKLALGTAEAGVYRGRSIVTWTSYEQRRIDGDRLRAEHPEIVQDFTKVIPCRRFVVRNLEGVEVSE